VDGQAGPVFQPERSLASWEDEGWACAAGVGQEFVLAPGQVCGGAARWGENASRSSQGAGEGRERRSSGERGARVEGVEVIRAAAGRWGLFRLVSAAL